jgi:hypothetical protein
VENDSIVILEPHEAEQLAWELAKRKDGTIRTFTTYRVAKKSAGNKVTFGRAHISLSTKGSDTGQLNHWEGEDFLESQPCTLQTLGGLIKKSSPSTPAPRASESAGNLDDRIARLLAAVDNLDEKSRREVSAQIAGVLDGVRSQDPAARHRALVNLSQIEDLVLRGQLSPSTLANVVQQYMPSNEWNVMPRGWQRGQASGEGHNCLIDTLLQLTTDLPVQQRLLEAMLIRRRLVAEGVTRPMAYLYASFHAVRVLELIGVNPDNYEIRTEWTHGGQRQISELEGLDHPTVLRLWNTGGHYEPITVPANADTADLQAHQTNQRLTRAARPAWMTVLLFEAAQGGRVEDVDTGKLAQFESKRADSPEKAPEGKEKEKEKTGDQPPAGLEVPDFPRWRVTYEGVNVLVFTDQQPDPPLEVKTVNRAVSGAAKALGVSGQALIDGTVKLRVVSGQNRFVIDTRGARIDK